MELVTIDPRGSRDLDQAFFAEQTKRGFRVKYAIADVAAFVTSGDAVDREAHRRGVTLYLPDGRSPLHPVVLSEGAASLLPREDRPALLWSIDLDDAGTPTDVRVERAVVRSREATTYAAVSREVGAGRAGRALLLLREIGELRADLERTRGGVSVAVPTQEVARWRRGYRLRYDAPKPAERWNAQISLLTGMCAARMMVDAGVGILRTLPTPDPRLIDRLRRTAKTLGIEWSDASTYPDVVRALDPHQPAHAAFLTQAVQVLRGAGYAVVSAGEPAPLHSAIAAPYAHVTAPLRRLVDRFGNEIVLALSAGAPPPAWAVDALAALPEEMGRAAQRAAAIERAVIDLVECLVLSDRVGDTLGATVVDLDDEHATVLVREPAVVARVAPVGRVLGDEVEVRVIAVDALERRLELEVVG